MVDSHLTEKSHPDLFAILNLQNFRGKVQAEAVKKLKPLLDMLQKGPTNFDDALQMRLVDQGGYNQDLLSALAARGVKTWSLRRYCDAGIVQAIFGDIGTEIAVIPQLIGMGKKDKKEKEKEHPATFDVTLDMISNQEQQIEDVSITVLAKVPRMVGLIYLDRAIEG
jgi:hypothetical protein